MRTSIFLGLMLTASAASYAATTHWSYEGQTGPEHWGQLSDAYETCHTGKFQSPINIRNPIQGELPALALNFHTAAEMLINNGHTLQVNVEDEDDFMLDGETFRLKQYHFHTPSENQIEGREFPLEAHFVHSNDAGDLAVVAVMFKVGAENAGLLPILDSIPQINHSVALKERMDLRPLLPQDLHYYRFSGSLTTPPCTEGLRWLVIKQPVTLSPAQLKIIQQALMNHNNRPVQPLNGRLIVE